MKRFPVFVYVLVLVATSACAHGIKIRTADLGAIREAKFIEGGWGSPPITQITTDREVVLLMDIISVPTGVQAHYDYYEDGHRRFWWDGAEFSYRTTRRTPQD